MRQQEQWSGSVTVFFSLIFTLLLSFSLTFYQMAAEAARGSFEFSAAKLAVESFLQHTIIRYMKDIIFLEEK